MHWWRIQWCPWELPMLRLYLSISLNLTQAIWKTRSFYFPLTLPVFLCKPHALNLNWPLLACDSSPIHRDKLHRFSPPTPLAQKKLRQNCNFNFFITKSNKAFILHVDPVLSRIKVLMIIEDGLREPVSQCNVDCIQPCTLYTFSGWLERLEREQWREHKKYAVYYTIYTVSIRHLVLKRVRIGSLRNITQRSQFHNSVISRTGTRFHTRETSQRATILDCVCIFVTRAGASEGGGGGRTVPADTRVTPPPGPP